MRFSDWLIPLRQRPGSRSRLYRHRQHRARSSFTAGLIETLEDRVMLSGVTSGDYQQVAAPWFASHTPDDAVTVMASAYRSYAHHHPGRYSAFTRMPLGGDDPEFTEATHAAAAPVIAVLSAYGLDNEAAFYAALEFWSAMHGFVLLEMTGVMNGIDTDVVFTDMVMRLAAGMRSR